MALKYRWQKRGFAEGLNEGIQMFLDQGWKTASMIAVSMRAEWGSFYTPSEYAVSQALREMRKIGEVGYTAKRGWFLLPRPNAIKLSKEGQIKFAKALLKPAKPNKAMQKAAKAHVRLIAESPTRAWNPTCSSATSSRGYNTNG